MSSYLDYLNILGKIDASKTLVTPDHFQFKLKEALTLNDIDYDKLKLILKQDPSFKPSDLWIENEKDKRFQALFSTMWPNLYKNLEEKKAAELAAAEAQKSKIVCSLLIDQEAKKYEEFLKSKLCHVKPAAVTSSYPLDACFASTSLTKPTMTTTTITTTLCPCTNCKVTPQLPSPTYDVKYPHLSSSYDFPYNTRKHIDELMKSSYNTDSISKETELLKSIQDSQEKLKTTLKIEKTTDLVDDIITKVGALQCEMRKKSSELKLKEEIIKRNKEHEELKNLIELKQNLLNSSLKLNSQHHFHHHHCHDHHKRPRSKSREIVIHDCVSRSSRPSSRSSRSSSRNRSSSTGDRHHSRHRSRSKSRSGMIRQSIHSVKPKVKSWNFNCKHDQNIY